MRQSCSIDQRQLQEPPTEAEGQLEDHHQRHRGPQGRRPDDHLLGFPHAGSKFDPVAALPYSLNQLTWVNVMKMCYYEAKCGKRVATREIFKVLTNSFQ